MAAKCPKCGAFVSKKGELCTLCKYQSMGSQGEQNTIGGTIGTGQSIHTDNSVHQTEVSENN